jgi:hypothetical protein
MEAPIAKRPIDDHHATPVIERPRREREIDWITEELTRINEGLALMDDEREKSPASLGLPSNDN